MKLFVEAGMIKYEKTLDTTHNIMIKFKQAVKRSRIAPEKLYTQFFDPNNTGICMRHEFIIGCKRAGIYFEKEEFEIIFGVICSEQAGSTGSKAKITQR